MTDVRPLEAVDERELLAVEALSDHPLAAVVRDGGERLGDHPRLIADGASSLTGKGVQARVLGKDAVIGKPGLFDGKDAPAMPEAVRVLAEELEAQGRTVMVVRHGDRFLGVLGLMDTPRSAAKGVIQRLRHLGVKRIIMLSGDNQTVADAVAKELGLDEARGGLMPEDKVA